MVRFTLDQETCRRLGNATQAVELCDGEGRVIGFFLPEGDAHGLPPAGLDSALSAEEKSGTGASPDHAGRSAS